MSLEPGRFREVSGRPNKYLDRVHPKAAPDGRSGSIAHLEPVATLPVSFVLP